MKKILIAIILAVALFATGVLAEKSATGKVYILKIYEAGYISTTVVYDLRDVFTGKIFRNGPIFTTKDHRTLWLVQRYSDGYDKDGNQKNVLWLRPATR